jgi:hypothetical protein
MPRCGSIGRSAEFTATLCPRLTPERHHSISYVRVKSFAAVWRSQGRSCARHQVSEPCTSRQVECAALPRRADDSFLAHGTARHWRSLRTMRTYVATIYVRGARLQLPEGRRAGALDALCYRKRGVLCGTRVRTVRTVDRHTAALLQRSSERTHRQTRAIKRPNLPSQLTSV